MLSVIILLVLHVKIIFFNILILILYVALHKKQKQIMAQVGKKVADPWSILLNINILHHISKQF